ncbi:PAS domain-containing protein [Altererythrobacter soli]|uniref:histidine kinase n=1 Tax=Croceibacterium soli TaxID=1739690 RepID=A0A6I4USQ9_9SPHN|nr:PAS domain-containing protein [Croceibacterium soli]MXP41496.1 PAS domain-containing protein [Croceibacterium soli]
MATGTEHTRSGAEALAQAGGREEERLEEGGRPSASGTRDRPSWTEADRLAALDRYEILDTPLEPLFDEIVQLAADVCEAPIAVVNFVAQERQWFKAEVGIDARELPLDVSICRHAILQPGLFVVPDLAADSRFASNPLVDQAGGLRFYAGVVLETPEGLPVGTICVLDTRPRPDGLASQQARVLKALARQVMTELELRVSLAEQAATKRAMRENAERVQLALDAGAIIGTWFWDLPADRFNIDEQFARSFGIDPARASHPLSLDEVIETVHPYDKEGLAAAIKAAIARGGPYAHQYRVRRADGNYYWIEANGHVQHSADRTPVSFPGVLIDVEEQRALRTERDRAMRLLETFAEAVPGVVYAKDRDGRMLVANRGTTELIGKPPEFYLGKTDVEFLADKAEALAVMANDRRIMETGVPEQLEEVLHLPDGNAAVWLSTKAPLRNEAGKVIGLIGSSVDITERRRAEERERLLAREVDHRAKNLLGVVQSMVQLTRADSTAEFKEAVAGRIQALARAHSLLAAGRWEGVNLSQLVAEELAPFNQGGERLAISGEPLRLNPAASQSLALAIHELATNASKYGSLSCPTGRLEVSWRLLQGEGESFELSWIESGGPLVTAPQKRGFGSTVIQSSIERQLGGTLQLGWLEEGLRCRITLPLGQIIEGEVSSPGEPARALPPTASKLSPGGRTVLIVEDEPLISLEMQAMVEAMGYNVLGPAPSVAEAQELLKGQRPDIAVLDVNVRGESSDSIARALTALRVPFVYCTGYAEPGKLPAPDSAKLPKPVDPAALRAALARLVAESSS